MGSESSARMAAEQCPQNDMHDGTRSVGVGVGHYSGHGRPRLLHPRSIGHLGLMRGYRESLTGSVGSCGRVRGDESLLSVQDSGRGDECAVWSVTAPSVQNEPS